MFTKLSDWRKRELGNRVPNALRPENLSHFQASFRLYLRIDTCGQNQIRNVLMIRCTHAFLGRALCTRPGNIGVGVELRYRDCESVAHATSKDRQ